MVCKKTADDSVARKVELHRHCCCNHGLQNRNANYILTFQNALFVAIFNDSFKDFLLQATV